MRFSVIIPVYNVKEYLTACVSSILKNDTSDCEIILIDDGSTDGVSPALCDKLAAENSNLIRVIHQENRGLGGARNSGIDAARGEYLIFLDSDDTVEPNLISRIFTEIERHSPDIVTYNLYSDDGEGHLSPVTANAFSSSTPFTLEERPDFLLSLPSAWSKACKRSLFIESDIRFPPRVLYEDIRTTTKLLAKAKSITAVDDCLYRYLQRPGSIMNSASVERNREIIDAFEDIISYFKKEGIFEKYSRELARLAVDHVMLAATVRVSLIDPKSPLLAEFSGFMSKHFPSLKDNPYLPRLSSLHKLLLFLIRKKQYRLIKLLFRIKG